MPPRARTLLVTALLPVAALTACADGSATSPATPSGGSSSAAASPTAGYPVTVDNCGTEVTLERAPERIVTIKSSTTEMVAALGLADRLVGTAFSDGPPPEAWADALADVPVLSDKVPGQEALLEVEPDFVYAGWESNFAPDAAGDRATLAQLGIGTYVSPAACKEEGFQPDPLTFEAVFKEIRQTGALLGAPDAAEDVVAEQQATLDAVEPLDGPTAVWWSSGTDTPYVGAGIGAPQMMLEAAGMTNVFADVHDTWSSVGWEQVVAADPDVLVLVDSAWNTADAKKAALAANPATAQLTAVREGRYAVVPFAASEAGVRNADTVADLVDQVRALGVGA
ncbi:putative F420-0 ABC transporter substrate-binding protein [Cellulomonas shaoxiangyii]|uniref:Putative F420-0 ABC transporter substrate-binding protein n=1 Tax=Cellulomonas shaoxiangyii TaxID=2566013 RepID=A0A4P7SIU0_9CELL|nr:putative F420-0 ABC transporter substrate-binding protein [Cellulomonas shaoxiangyii]QCB94012.1 putative F420-0 ABC transporter substrate-binding protein [Cellulomonas shaoxiangyii]TGY80399.1 putative F420-0 ABC transporter substrate-binding protein [Cellulomonas shaoxiangyii]